MEALLVDTDSDNVETNLPESAADAPAASAQPRVDHVVGVLGHLANRQRLRALTVLYNAPHGLELPALAAALDRAEAQVQPVLDRLTRAGLVSVLPVLDDETLGWRTRYLTTPAAREWLERVALANGREALVPA